MQNRECKPCRHRVRRSQLHSVSAGAAKTPYPLAPSSFPNCDRFTGSQFGHLEFYNAARDLDDGGRSTSCEYRKARTSIRRKSRARLWSIEGVRGNHPKGFPGLFSFARRFLFGEAKRKCRPFPLFPKRERKEWVQKRVQPQFAALQKSPFFFLGTRHSGAGPSTRMISSPIRRMQHHGTT